MGELIPLFTVSHVVAAFEPASPGFAPFFDGKVHDGQAGDWVGPPPIKGCDSVRQAAWWR